ncbi:MAG: alpha/beta fold hydrolase [Candidatus Thiodiazotropha sp.]
MSCASTPSSQEVVDPERSVCGLKESLFFWLWRLTAGAPDPLRIAGISNIEDHSIITKDRRTLRGYKLNASSTLGAPKGYLLVAPGNAMLADRIVTDFLPFASAGYDVYIFDYRGYGRSDGKARLKAILSDYSEIITHLDSFAYSNRIFYGVSFGGMVLLDALRDHSAKSRMVIDSTPSRFSNYGCPVEHDPMANLPENSSHVLIIVGGRDKVVTLEMSKELVNTAQKRGASLLRDANLAHPFMDLDALSHSRRMQAVKSFLLHE